MASVDSAPEHFKLCSTCRTPIAFVTDYYRCSVSTCNRKRFGYFFCSVSCWDAHAPMLRHRDAWAEAMRAPTREAFVTELEAEATKSRSAERREEQSVTDDSDNQQKVVGSPAGEVPNEVLIVVSKVKAYIRARSGMNTSDGVVSVLSNHLRQLCEQAIAQANGDGRKTVMDRDFEAAVKKESGQLPQ